MTCLVRQSSGVLVTSIGAEVQYMHFYFYGLRAAKHDGDIVRDTWRTTLFGHEPDVTAEN
jgi:hypothetical protein